MSEGLKGPSHVVLGRFFDTSAVFLPETTCGLHPLS